MTTIAATAQRAVLRDIPPTVEGIDVAVSYVSAAREALIGGDLYEAMPTRFGLRALIGDVRGKGLEAVQLASTVLGAFRGACLHEASLVKMSRDLDSLVQALGDDEDFVTALLIEVHEDTITIASCGHHAPLCVSPDGELLFLQPTSSGAPLGLLAEPTTTVFPWPSGSRLLLYTDGLVEARNDEGMFFPLGIHSDLLSRESLQGCLEGLVNELEKFTGEGINDDLGLMLLRRP